MINKILKLVKRLILGAFVLYGYNMLIEPIGLIVPINLVTLSSFTILGFPALLSFIIINILIY